ncbi:hypothetical protein [Mesorhizobium muleiense]|nr:hypothetical protein [Mesorhizobium muleiense]MCF6113947.1 hypothetical protein [Mesorhizobium muleiense]
MRTVGSYGDDPLVWILSFGNGSVGFYINDDRCGKFDMLGEYTAIGD